MDLSKLTPAEGSVRNNKRLGRGQGSGGSTAGRGHKGAQSRSGYSRKRGHEGGQMPLQRRVPKFGFTNPTRKEHKGINLDALQTLAESKGLTNIDPSVLRENGLLGKNHTLKVLGRGEVKGALNVTAHAFSQAAKEAIEAKGGKAETIQRA
jgi:large subunit ribosomal protein L15